jgi:hypothetical protein
LSFSCFKPSLAERAADCAEEREEGKARVLIAPNSITYAHLPPMFSIAQPHHLKQGDQELPMKLNKLFATTYFTTF